MKVSCDRRCLRNLNSKFCNNVTFFFIHRQFAEVSFLYIQFPHFVHFLGTNNNNHNPF